MKKADFTEIWSQQIQELRRRRPQAVEQILMPATYPTDVPILFIKKSDLTEILTLLKTDPLFDYVFLSDLTASDETPEFPRFRVIYNLYSLSRHNRIRIKVSVEDDELVPSVIAVWEGAGWAEREVFDMFGIRFEGHPDLRRILTHSSFHGHPLRKDYPITQYQIATEAEPVRPELLWPEAP